MSDEPKAKRKRGRPKGSKTKVSPQLAHIPLACPSCGSTKLTGVPGAKNKTLEHFGTLADGYAYTSITWRQKICKCGQRVTVREYAPDIREKKPKK